MSLQDWASVAEIASAIIAGIATCISLNAAKQSRKAAEESGKLNEQMTRPRVLVYAEPSKVSPYLYNLVVENAGMRLARNIVLSVKGDDIVGVVSEGDMESRLSNMKPFIHGIKMLPAGGARKYFMIDAYGDNYSRLASSRASVGVTYNNEDGRAYKAEYPLDFASMPDHSLTGREDKVLLGIASSLKGIGKSVDKIARNR